jgi:hypothetical protein
MKQRSPSRTSLVERIHDADELVGLIVKMPNPALLEVASILDDIDASGIAALELGPVGYLPLGHGIVAVPKVLETLDRTGCDGYAAIEQDRVPGAGGSPLDDLLSSMELRSRLRGATS